MGGGSIVAEKIAKSLLKRGHEVFVITTSDDKTPQELTVGGVETYRLPLNLYFLPEFHSQNTIKRTLWHLIDLFNINAYKKIKKILKKETPDIVHIHNYRGLSPLSFKVVKDLNLSMVFTAHDYSPICVRTSLLNGEGQICEDKNLPCRFYNWIQKIVIDGKPDVVTAPSRFVLEKLESECLFQDTEKMILPNPITPKKDRTKKAYDTIDILFVGSLSKHKGPDILIKSFKKISKSNLRLHIVGKGPLEQELRRLAGDDPRIRFHGFLRGEELENMYRMANLTVLPSIWYDNSPMVIYESFSNSTPVLASRIGGIPELVIDGYNGFLFEPGDVEGLSSLIEKISRDPSILAELERGAYDSCKSYDIDEVIKRLEDIYRELKGP
ncbi:MAG: glycosyltransferase family 4 protein [Candidatus Methanofastidiosum sp.]|nr:glycosyltransferase family 4 protein [Methanofastidiosum sp.]